MTQPFLTHLAQELDGLKTAGLYKSERVITSMQSAEIKVAGMPMAAVVSPKGDELYVSTGRGNAIAVIDLSKNEEVARIPVGERVWGIALSPDGDRLYTANGKSNDVSVIDIRARKELRRIKVGDGPWGIAVAPKL